MCVCVCVCVLGMGWGLGGMELRVGSNIMICFFVLYTAASHTAHVLYIYIFLLGVYIYALLVFIYVLFS